MRQKERRECATFQLLNVGRLFYWLAYHLYFFLVFLRRRYVERLTMNALCCPQRRDQLSLLTLNWSKLLQLDVIARRRRGTSALRFSLSFFFYIPRISSTKCYVLRLFLPTTEIVFLTISTGLAKWIFAYCLSNSLSNLYR